MSVIRSFLLVLAPCVTLILGAIGKSESVLAETLASWVELVGPGREASVRSIVSADANCPTLDADGQPLPMKVRAEPGPLFSDAPPTTPPASFPVRVCEVMISQGVSRVLLENEPLPLPRADVSRIVVFGDTGCRIKEAKVQDCKRDWPYASLVTFAAEAHPDLVIHVGDYLYRESCDTKATDCPDTPIGYGWKVWNNDFFKPSAPLLATAPWIMVRGNHETCARAGEGWFRFLDHAAPENECAEISKSFVIALGGLGFVVMDSGKIANENGSDDDDDDDDSADASRTEDLTPIVKQRYAEIARSVPSPGWLLTHAPFNAVRLKHHEAEVANTLQQQAIGELLPSDIKMIVSGHVHIFEALSFADADPPRPPQLVVGTGGVKLAKEPDVPKKINGARVTDALFLREFGFIVWDRDGANWKGRLFDRHNKQIARCDLAGTQLTCETGK